jgi:hypothetical protein
MENKMREEEQEERKRKDRDRDEGLRAALSFATGESWRNHARARDVLHNELGWVGNPPENRYRLNRDTRDILLVHARQDASHALENTIGILKAVRVLKLLSVVVVALLFAVALRVWHLI